MKILQTIAVAFSMYSAIPMPQFDWNERNMKYALCAFPMIGVVIGACEAAAWVLGNRLDIPQLLLGAILCLIPVLITGGIHLDGYSDTCDALASHAEPEKLQAILKDPHVGSFAVIRLCTYFILSFALWTVRDGVPGLSVLLIFVISRALSGLALCSFPLAKNTGLAYMFATAADKRSVRTVLTILLVLCAAALCLCGIEGLAELATAGAVYGFYYHTAMRHFGGLSGDLAGWFLQKCELWMLAASVAVQIGEKLI